MVSKEIGFDLRYPVPWNQVERETLGHFQTIVRMDTTSPPGNETMVAEYLKQVLEREGIPARLLALEPKRANLVARIRGNGSKRPILVMGHTDVVGVQREKWSVDPFAAVRKDGYIWGRGTGDDKDNVTAGLMLLLLLKRQGVRLDRDVIFLAEGGEEGYSPTGVRYVIPNHWEEIDAEFALAEGGGGIIKDGKVIYISVATSEKVRLEVQLIARGTAGHGSIPRPDYAVVSLANAISRIAAWAQPITPVMEGKSALFKRFGGIDAWPLCLDTQDADEIVQIVRAIAPGFAGINLEDISAPRCFEIEARLRESLDIPVFHDDQHGTAVVALAPLESALRIVDKPMGSLRVVIAGVGAAGVAISKILLEAGVAQIIGVDRKGAIWEGRDDLNVAKLWFAEHTNPDRREGTLSEVLPGADVFVGVSGPGLDRWRSRGQPR